MWGEISHPKLKYYLTVYNKKIEQASVHVWDELYCTFVNTYE